MTLLAAVALLVPMLAAASAPEAQPWSPRLVTGSGDDVNVRVDDGLVRLAGGLHALVASVGDVLGAPAERRPTGFLVLPPHQLSAPANQIAVDLDSVTPPGSTVALDARARRDNGRWTQWVPARPGDPAVLPVASRLVQVRLVLQGVTGAAPPGVDRLRVIPDLIEKLLNASPSGPERRPGYRVFATREGLVGRTTANGTVIGPDDRFVALPSRRALSRRGSSEYAVKVCADNGRCAWAPVWDVGPWNTTDDYWHRPARRESFSDLPQGVPEAQAAFRNGYNGGRDQFGRRVANPAGIDLSNAVFTDALHLQGNDWVTVSFMGAEATGDEGGLLSRVRRVLPVRAGPSAQAREVGVAADGVPLAVQCHAGSGWLKIGREQFVPESGLARVPEVPAC